MWVVRVLSGPQAGQFFPLKSGANVLGRAPSCDIKILSPNVSKEHIKIDVLSDKFIITDMGSRNGTFVNGVQIRSVKINAGDRIGLHDVLLEIIPATQVAFLQQAQYQQQVAAAGYGPLGGQQVPPPRPMPQSDEDQSPGLTGNNQASLLQYARDYIDRVALPGVYRLSELVEFKWLLVLFMAAFILLVTSLSTIPLLQILRDSIEQQSQQHALTIATTLARVNEGPIREGVYSAINVSTANRVGVKEALIIQALDGKVIAPAGRAETFPNLPFVHEARKLGREAVSQVDSNTVVALYPIEAFNAETGSRGAVAYSVVVYDMSSLAVDDNKTISLFIITLFIASLLGAVLYFFLYKIIEHPIEALNSQLATALRDGRDDLKTEIEFPALQKLAANINSSLTRAITGTENAAPRAIEHDRRLEMTNIVELIGFAAIVISAHDRTIAAVNQAFEERTRLDPNRLLNQPVNNVGDQALKLNLVDLMDRLEQTPDQLANNELEFSGYAYQLIAQAIFGTDRIAYFIVILVPAGGEA